MIRVAHAQGIATLVNEYGTAYQLSYPVARALYRKNAGDKAALRSFLIDMGGDDVIVDSFLVDAFDAAMLENGLSNMGLPLETLHELQLEKSFFEAYHDKPARVLALHPSELGVIATSLAKEGVIKDEPLRTRRDEAARGFLVKELGVGELVIDETLPIGEFR